MRIALTGSIRQARNRRRPRTPGGGHTVIGLDVVGARGPGFVQVDLTDYGQVVDALTAVNDRHDGDRRARAPRGDPGPRHPERRRHVPQQHRGDVQRVLGRRSARHPPHRLRVERDRAGSAVRRAAAVHPRRRGVRPAPRVGLLARQGARGADGGGARAVASGAVDHGAAVLERDGARRTTPSSPRTTPMPGDASGTCGATSTPGMARRRSSGPSRRPRASIASSSPPPTR